MGAVPLSIDKGRSFSRKIYLRTKLDTVPVTFEPIDLNGSKVRAQIRETAKQDSALIVDFTAVISDPANGEITISLTESETSVDQSRGFYDVVTEDTQGDTKTRVRGPVSFNDVPSEVPV